METMATVTTQTATRAQRTPAQRSRTQRTPAQRARAGALTKVGRAKAPGGGLGTALDLLDRSRATLVAACRAETTTDRYVQAHLGALRAAAALLAARGPRGRGPGVRDVWDDLRRVAPELGEWADYLALAGRRRVHLEQGAEPAGWREADDLLRGAETFLQLVQAALGLPVTPVEPPLSAAALA